MQPQPMITPMIRMRSWQGVLDDVGRTSASWSASWWHVVRLGAMMLVLALSPSSYRRDNRLALARHVYLGTAPIVSWFAVLSALVSLVLIRIVVVTALSYGLSQYALEMVVRVLVLELIPLAAAVFVALRCTLPSGTELEQMHARGELLAQQRAGVDLARRELLPRVLAGIVAVVMLAAVSCLISVVLAYLSVYGFTTSAFAGFTRTLGQIFNPAVAMIFTLKTLFFSLAVSLVPVAAFLHGAGAEGPRSRTSAALASLVRMFSLVLLIEIASLMGNYY